MLGFSPEQVFFKITLAVIPCLIFALIIYIRDKHRPEPLWLIVLSFGLGIVAFFLNLLLSWYPHSIFQGGGDTIIQKAIHVFAVIALPEELCKFIMVRGLLFRNRDSFTEPIDGIVYAVMVGMGFAAIENIVYVMKYGAGYGILRMFSAIPAHAMLGVFMGFYLGIAKFTRRKKKRFTVLGLFIPIAFHGFYNFFLFVHFIPGMWIGAGICLLLAFFFSARAISIHQRFSPYNPDNPRFAHLHQKPIRFLGGGSGGQVVSSI